MPPKKVTKLDHNQSRLTGLWGSKLSEPADDRTTDVNNNTTKKERKFKDHWLKLYSWLVYEKGDEGNDFMFCKLCTDHQKTNGMNILAKNRNFQNSTLTRHASLPDHKLLVEAPVHHENLKQFAAKNESAKDKAIKVLLKACHWICSENLPIAKFKSLIQLLHELQVPDIAVLKQCPFEYDSEFTASELLDALAKVAEDDLNDQLSTSPCVTVLTDESTDITNTKRLVLYAQIVTKDMKPHTVYVNNTECNDASGKGIATSILTELSKRGVQQEKVMSLGSDGASVMTGKYNGVAAIMRRGNPHMVNVHCVAHRLALCTSQAAADIPLLKKHQQILTDLFYYFKGSSKRESRLKEVQEILDEPCLTIKEIHSVRWLSYFNALTTVFRSLDSILTYLEELHMTGKDCKASGLKKKMATNTFIGTTYMLMDAMAPVTILSQFFQTENVDVALVKVNLDLCLSDLENVRTLESPYCKQLKEDLQGNRFRGQHEITNTNFDLQNLTSTFIDALTSNISSRFPDTDILKAFSVLGMRPVSFLSAPDLEEYGQTEIQKLCEFYGQDQTVSWKDEDKVEHEKTSEALIDKNATINEWQLAKQVTKAQNYPRDSVWKLWHLLNLYHAADFPNLIKLAQLAVTSAVHTAGCERGFSVQNQLLTKSRNRLTVEKQNQLMRVRLSNHDRNEHVEKALPVYKNVRDRRLFSHKVKPSQI